MIGFLSVLRELRPVRAHTFVVVEPPARVGDRKGHRCQALGSRVDDHHRVLLPWVPGLPVAQTAPEVDDLLATPIGTAGAAEFTAYREIVGKRVAHDLETRTDLSLYLAGFAHRHGLLPVG